jgi:hypothetical protein
VSGTRGLAGVDGHAGIHDDLTPRTVSGRSPARRSTGVDTAWVRGSHRDMPTCAAPSRIRLGQVLLQATAASREHGRCPAAMATPAIRAGQQRSSHRSCRTLPLWPSGMPSRFRTPRTDGRVRYPPGGCGGYRNRSPGWRPLVGCSQRRWTRATRAVRRPRSWPRT